MRLNARTCRQSCRVERGKLCHALTVRGTNENTETFTFLLSTAEQDGPLQVRFEPIGPDYLIRPGDHLRIIVTNSPSDDPIEVTSGCGWVTIWPAPAAQIRATNASGEQSDFLI